jgi:hypothetical protein
MSEFWILVEIFAMPLALLGLGSFTLCHTLDVR